MKTNSTLTVIGGGGFLAGVALVFWSALPTLADKPLITSTYDERNYALVYNRQQDEYLAALTQNGTPVVQRLRSNGSPTNAVAAPWMGLSYIGAGEIQVAYNPHLNQYLAVMAGVAPYPWPAGQMTPMIFGALLDGSANLVGMPFILTLGGTYSSYSESPYLQNRHVRTINVAFNTVANEYLVTYQSSATHAIHSQRVSEAGGLLGSPNQLRSSIGTHALAYGPVVSPETPTGRYAVVLFDPFAESVTMLGSAGEVVVNAIPFHWGSTASFEFSPDVVYADIPGHTPRELFLVVWDDENNKAYDNPSNLELTGVWGSYVNAVPLNYYSGAEPECEAFFLSGSCFHNFDGWEARIAYDPSTLMFHLASRQTPVAGGLCPAPLNYHISLTSFSGTSLASRHTPAGYGPFPVISRTTGAYPGSEMPRDPAIAVNGFGKFVVAWDDARNSGTGNQRDLYGTSVINDECSGAIALTENVYFSLNTAGAANDGISPCLGRARTKGVWFTYKPSGSGMASVDTCPSDFDTNLEIFTGNCGALTSIACNEDSSACGGYWQAALKFPCTAGTTYYIYAGGYNDQSGQLQIRAGLAVTPIILTNLASTASGAFRFTLKGDPGDYIVFGTTNFLDWHQLEILNNVTGSVDYTNTPPPGSHLPLLPLPEMVKDPQVRPACQPRRALS